MAKDLQAHLIPFDRTLRVLLFTFAATLDEHHAQAQTPDYQPVVPLIAPVLNPRADITATDYLHAARVTHLTELSGQILQLDQAHFLSGDFGLAVRKLLFDNGLAYDHDRENPPEQLGVIKIDPQDPVLELLSQTDGNYLAFIQQIEKSLGIHPQQNVNLNVDPSKNLPPDTLNLG